MKGFKAFKKGYICNGFQYEVGKEYTHEGELEICESGFHFCENLIDVFGYYSFDRDNIVLAEVEATGDIQQEGTKYCTNKIRIVRAVDWSEVDAAIKDGNWNSGNYNSGKWNSGKWNSGDYNSGNCNSGDYNSGNWNSGGYNSGNRNSGNYNSGNRNSGGYNSGNRNSGFFNSDTPTVRLFNKDSGMTFNEIFALGVHWWALEESKDIIVKLPNYDAEIFYQATGIDWREEVNDESNK